LDWWILKQLRAMVLEDLNEFVPHGYFEKDLHQFKLPDEIQGSKHFSNELKWGYLAGNLGRELFFGSVQMSARQVSASDVLMNLGLLAGLEAMCGVTAQLAKDLISKGSLNDNVKSVEEQLENQYTPIALNNMMGALEQYLRYLNQKEKELFLPLLEKSLFDSRLYAIEKKQEDMQENKSEIRLFISHSSAEKLFVEHLIELIRAALNLSSSQIRCTSINGYRLPVGVNTDEQLRREVHEADAFIGVISRQSLNSIYVVFELGARWGAGRSLSPVLVPGTKSEILGGPLASINALSAGDRAQLYQLVENLGQVLDIKPEMPAVYDRYIDAIVKQNKSVTSKAEESSNRFDSDELSGGQIKILKLLAKIGDKRLVLQHVSNAIKEDVIRVEYYLEQLVDKNLILSSYALGESTTYSLSKNGRAYLVEKNLV